MDLRHYELHLSKRMQTRRGQVQVGELLWFLREGRRALCSPTGFLEAGQSFYVLGDGFQQLEHGKFKRSASGRLLCFDMADFGGTLAWATVDGGIFPLFPRLPLSL